MTTALPTTTSRKLTNQEFHVLAEVPPELEWFANINNEKTRRAYKIDIEEFTHFIGIQTPHEMRTVTRAHVIAWRKDLEARELAPSTIRRKLSALASLFDHLCESNAVTHNPVGGVKRPKAGSNEGSTPALGEKEARDLLERPDTATLKGKRDTAILATLLYHGIRREELTNLKVKDLHTRKGVMHYKILGKGNKIRYIPIHPQAMRLIDDYLEKAGHREDTKGPLFRPVRNNVTGQLNKALNPNSIYTAIVKPYAGLGVHSLRATAATNALDHEADIAKVQQMLGHANISTTRLYDRRKSKPEDSPVFRIKY